MEGAAAVLPHACHDPPWPPNISKNGPAGPNRAKYTLSVLFFALPGSPASHRWQVNYPCDGVRIAMKTDFGMDGMKKRVPERARGSPAKTSRNW